MKKKGLLCLSLLVALLLVQQGTVETATADSLNVCAHKASGNMIVRKTPCTRQEIKLSAENLSSFQGDTGPQGPIGLTGPQGAKGDRGLDGVQGPVGPQGIKGDRGDVGPQGAVGLTGLTGAQGTKGDRGLEGPQGQIGPQGPTGAKGDAGARGPAVSALNGWEDIGSVDLLPATAYLPESCDYRLKWIVNETPQYYFYKYLPLELFSLQGSFTASGRSASQISWINDGRTIATHLTMAQYSYLFEANNYCSSSSSCAAQYLSYRNSKFYKDTEFSIIVSPQYVSLVATDIRSGSFPAGEAPPIQFKLKASSFHVEERCNLAN